jgi:GMP synthase (glutamine-hydrolysing)
MKSAIALRHVHFEDLGVLEPFLADQGYAVRYVDAPTEDLAGLDAAAPDLVVVLGGPIGAGDEVDYPFLAQELDFVRRRLDAGGALLGICLGAQIIARVLGAAVKPMGVKEIGFSPLVFTGAGQVSPLGALGALPVFHWHGDQFDIPAGAVRLAGTEICRNQAFAFGHQVLGLQFHLEADPARIERWLVGHAAELSGAGVDPGALRGQAHDFGPTLASAAQDVIGAWLGIADVERNHSSTCDAVAASYSI